MSGGLKSKWHDGGGIEQGWIFSLEGGSSLRRRTKPRQRICAAADFTRSSLAMSLPLQLAQRPACDQRSFQRSEEMLTTR